MYNEARKPCERIAPRSIQFSLVSECNLACEFCYSDKKAKQAFSPQELLQFFYGLSDWGVFEIAFGGGEPLLYPGFAHLIKDIYENTNMGLNVTTNGLLLDEDSIDRLVPYIGEFRISAYSNNSYTQTLKRLQGKSFGVNYLVTPENLGLLEPSIYHFLELGANNILLLSYKGQNEAYHLNEGQMQQFKSSLMHLSDLPLRLETCLYPLMPDLAHLFPLADCAAGTEMLSIASNKTARACSFHHKSYHFNTIDDLKDVYSQIKEQRHTANRQGCHRELFHRPNDAIVSGSYILDIEKNQSHIWIWDNRTSNNSASHTVLGEFKTEKEANKAYIAFKEVFQQIAEDAAKPGWFKKLKYTDEYRTLPPLPFVEFGRKFGYEWTREKDEQAWVDIGNSRDVEIDQLKNFITIYYDYAIKFPTIHLFKILKRFGSIENKHSISNFQLEITFQNNNLDLKKQLKEFISEYSKKHESNKSHKIAAPWSQWFGSPGNQAKYRGSGISGTPGLEIANQKYTLTLCFGDFYSGCLAIGQWLKSCGINDFQINVLDNDY